MENRLLYPSVTALGQRLFDLAEVILAALGGSLVGPLFLGILGVPLSEALNDAKVLGLLIFADASCTMGFIWIMQRLHGQNIASLGWYRSNSSSELWIGLKIFPGLILIVLLISFFFQLFLPNWVTKENPMLVLIDGPVDVIIFLAASIYAGGFKEELQRAFILLRFERFLGGVFVGVVVWSVSFGALHYTQGFDNSIKAGVLGLVLGILYWKRKRLEGPVVAHALFDILVVGLVYFFPVLSGSG